MFVATRAMTIELVDTIGLPGGGSSVATSVTDHRASRWHVDVVLARSVATSVTDHRASRWHDGELSRLQEDIRFAGVTIKHHKHLH